MKKFLLTIAFLTFSNLSFAQINEKNCDLVIKNNQFSSQKLQKSDNQNCEFELKSGKKMTLTICNLSEKPVEFESHDLFIEKIIKGNSKSEIKIRKLEKGEIYNFEEEFNHVECQFRAI